MSEVTNKTENDIDRIDSLEQLTLSGISSLLQESQNAFLPSLKSPNETTETLLKKFLNDPNFAILGYMMRDNPVSYIIALSGRSSSEIAIGPMYVASTFRGKGIGKKQVEDFVDIYATKGYRSIFTKTWGQNSASKRTFEDLGFEIDSVLENDRANGDSTVSYVLTVQN